MIWLKAGEARHCDTRFRVLDGPQDIATAEARIAAIARQPDTDCPELTGRFAPLHNAALNQKVQT